MPVEHTHTSSSQDELGCLLQGSPTTPLNSSQDVTDSSQDEFVSDSLGDLNYELYTYDQIDTTDPFIDLPVSLPSLETACDSPGTHTAHTTFYIQANRAIRASGVPNYLGCRIPVPSNLNIEFWEKELTGYHDTELVDFLKFGWPIGHDGSKVSLGVPSNHKGATEFAPSIDSYIVKELDTRAIIGPMSRHALGIPLVVSPLSSTPKKDSDDRRILHDLSFPPGTSVNDGISKRSYLGTPVKVQLPSVEDFVDLLKQIDPELDEVLMYKFDIRRCYRQIRIDPGDLHLLGFHWDGEFYADISLPMGLRSAVYICQRITSAIRFIAHKHGLLTLNYIDDFPGGQLASRAEANTHTFEVILKDSGFEENVGKRCLPDKRMAFKGVMFNLQSHTLEITPDRLQEIQVELDAWLASSHASRHDVQVLVGRLNFVSDCVRAGKVFMARLLAFLRSTPLRGSIPIPPECKKDIFWWRTFMASYNGVSMMLMEAWSAPDELLATDACLVGGGGWCEGEFFHSSFPPFTFELGLHINDLELLVIVVALKLWKNKFRGKRILVQCDNKTSVDVLNSGRARSSFFNSCLREVAFVAAQWDFEIKAVHIPGVSNRIPDLLSRWDLEPSARTEFEVRTEGFRVRERFVSSGLFRFSHDW